MRRLFMGLYWLATLCVPVVIVLSAVGILLTPLYIQIEYRLPGFPEDPYGFTTEDRLYWANVSRKYLLNNQSIEYLANQKLDDNTSLYNQRELRHMVDVKNVIRSASIVYLVCLGFLGGFGIFSKRNRQQKVFIRAISTGGWISMGLIIAIFGYLVLNFNSLFTNFHRIFFEGETWLFQYSDTLIRLFPLRFWRDAFIWIGLMTLTAGFGVGRLGRNS